MTYANIKISLLAASLLSAWGTAAMAQNAADTVQRNVNQEKRIEQGLKSGQLSTQEAGKLEREQAQVDKLESNALKDGKMSNAEKRRIERAENKTSADIHREKTDAQTANPNSVSSKRMQADVERNVHQQERVEQGIQSGALTNREAGKLEHGQAHVDNKEAGAAANGHIGADEQRSVQASENNQSKRIHKKKTNGAER
ncbi:MAG: hypothetical protein ABI612_11460 [Betaproteobacteria bacterium]